MSGIDSDVDLLRLLDLASLTKGFSGAEIANSTGFGNRNRPSNIQSQGFFLYCVVGHGAEYCLCYSLNCRFKYRSITFRICTKLESLASKHLCLSQGYRYYIQSHATLWYKTVSPIKIIKPHEHKTKRTNIQYSGVYNCTKDIGMFIWLFQGLDKH